MNGPRRSDGLTETLAKFASRLTYDELPTAVRRQATRLVLDSVACQLGGQATSLGRSATSLARQFGGRPQAAVIGTDLVTALPHAAYVNARAGSLLDADDTLTSVSHHGTPTVAAALAAAQGQNADGRTLLAAVVAGFEVGARWSIGLGSQTNPLVAKEPGITRVAPSSPAVLAAAVATAHTAGANEELLAHVLGLAGLYTPVPVYKWLQEASLPTSKARDSGWLAQAGLMAYHVAASGVTGYRAILDGVAGLWRSEGYERVDGALVLNDLGRRWYILETTFKPWPCQKWMHQALSALADILAERSLQPADVQEVIVYANTLSSAGHFAASQLDNPILCQFSYPHAVAMLLMRVPPGPAWLTPDIVNDPVAMDLRTRVRVVTPENPQRSPLHDPDGLIRHVRGGVEVVTIRGRFHRERQSARGDPWAPEGPMDDEALVAKFHHMADGLVPNDPTWARTMEAVARLILNLESTADLWDITARLEPPL